MPLTVALLLLASHGLAGKSPTGFGLAGQGSAVQETSAIPMTVTDADRPVVAEKKWALCVGAGEYTKGLAPLKYAAGDARAFAGRLVAEYGFTPTTLSLLADHHPASQGGDASDEVAPVPEKPPTSALILGELDRLLADQRLDRGDLFVFYFSGHGVGTGKGDYLMPTDIPESEAAEKGVAVREVVKRFVDAGLKNVLIIADACRSGAKNPFGTELQDLGRKANIAVLLGCAPGQRSYEVPDLKHGAFTSFLIKGMGDRALVEPVSGALWASSLAKKVAKQVKSYTQADYPSDPQIPVAWTETSQDVLLAAYPPKVEGKSEFAALLKAQGTQLGSQPYAQYLAGVGQALADQGRKTEAIQALKTLDGLGLATWRDLSALALALYSEGRENETGSLVMRAVREPKRTDLSEFVVILGKPALVGAERYRQAARTVTRPETYGFVGAALRIKLERLQLNADDALVAREISPYTPLFPKESTEGLYLAANVALGERRYADAITLAERSMSTMGEATTNRASRTGDMRRVRYRAANALGDKAKVDAVLSEGEGDPQESVEWATLRLRRMKERGDKGYVAAARALAAKTNSVDQIGRLLVLLGADAGTIRDDAARVSAAHPYVWRGYVHLWVADSAKKGLEIVEELPAAAFKYTPNRADLVQYALNEWDDVLETGRADQRFKGVQAAHARNQLSGIYARYWDDIKDDPEALGGMGRMLMRSMQTTRGAIFGRMVLWPYAQKQAYGREVLSLVSLTLALNGADEPTAKAVFAAMATGGTLNARAILRYAAHQALVNDAKEAERALALWPKLGGGAPDAKTANDFDAIRGLIAIRRGDKPAARKYIEAVKDLHHELEFPFYIAQYEFAQADTIFERLGEMVIEPDGELSDQQIAGTISIVRSLSDAKTDEDRHLLRIFSGQLGMYPGHPWVKATPYEGHKGLSLYAGEFRWRGTLTDGDSIFDVTMTLKTSPKGELSGELNLEGGTKFGVAGEVDALGNLSGRLVKDGGPVAIFGMKLPTIEAAADRDLQEFASYFAVYIKSEHEGGLLRLVPTSATPAGSASSSGAKPGSAADKIGKLGGLGGG